jgi:hypothetical protein
LRQEPNDELDEPVLAPFAPVPQPGDSDEERATADEDAHGAERRVAVNDLPRADARGHQDNQHGDSSTHRYPVCGRPANRRTVRRGLLAETAPLDDQRQRDEEPHHADRGYRIEAEAPVTHIGRTAA